MNPTEHKNFSRELAELIVLSMEGHANVEQTRRLQQILLDSAPARQYYYEVIASYIGLNSPEVLRELNSKPETVRNYISLYDELASQEEQAPTVLLPRKRKGWTWRKKPRRQEPANEIVEPVQIMRPLVKRSYFAMKFFAACAAVFLALLVYVYYHPRPIDRYVAHIDDVLNVQWSQGTALRGNRTSLSDRDFYSLLSGYVRMQFDSGTEVVVEGPSVFRCNSENSLFLEQGKVFVKVAAGQEGFVVRTPSAKITDLGTQFGVHVRPGGLVEVQMVEGKALVEYENDAAEKEAVVLSAGNAMSIDSVIRSSEAIPYDEYYFARTINSQEKIVWRGQSLSLADIAGGGNGLGNGTINQSIDLITGQIDADTHIMRVPGPGKYIPTPHVPYVDGVFVPDGGQGPVQISSTGLVYEACPDTDGHYSWDIHYGLYDVNPPSERKSFLLNGKEVSLASCPTLCLHANAGITFDLLQIRQFLHGVTAASFTAYCGIDKEVLEHERRFGKSRTKADVTVLLDGVVVFEKKALDLSDDFIPVNVRIKGDARFLTLISTNSAGDDTSYLSWVLWANPRIHLNTTSR